MKFFGNLKIIITLLIATFLALGAVPQQANAANSPFQVTFSKAGQPIILLKEDYQNPTPAVKNNFFSNQANILRCMVFANPNTIYLAKIPERAGGILIYTKEKDIQKVQKDLDKMSQAFNSPPSQGKTNLFVGVLAFKDYTKIIHQEQGSFILENSQGKSQLKKMTPLNIDNFLKNKKSSNPPLNQSKNTYYSALAQNLTVKQLKQDLHTSENQQNINNNKFLGSKLRTTLETNLGEKILSASKSPDNQKIAFATANNLYITNLEGTKITKIINGKPVTGKIYFYWSSNSKRLVYQQKNDAGYYSLYSVNVDGSNNKQLTKGSNCQLSRMSPNSQKIAFLMAEQKESYNLWTIQPDGSAARLLAKNASSELLLWSPDSQRIAFLEKEKNKEDYIIWLANANGKNNRALAKGKSKEVYATFSPDGNKIAFVSNNRVWVINSDSSGLTKLFDSKNISTKPGGHAVLKGIQWLSNGSRIDCLIQHFHPDYYNNQQPYASGSLILNLQVK